MSLQIDCSTYDKAARYPDLTPQPNGRRLGHGYEARPLQRPTGQPWPLLGITIHSSEDGPGQTFAGLCNYLADSADVSAHYVVGPGGDVARILDPGPYLAYHAGVSRWTPGPACNLYMVGIEVMHHAGGPAYTSGQMWALTALCRVLMADHPTIRKANIAAHRWIALPPGRKQDPTDWTDAALQTWIAGL